MMIGTSQQARTSWYAAQGSGPTVVTLVTQEASTGNGDQTFITAPVSIAVGDLLICAWVHRATSRTETITGTGWTTILNEYEITGNQTRRASAVAWKVADAGDVGLNVIVGWSAGTSTAATMSVFRPDVTGTWTLDDSGTTLTTGSGASATLATAAVTNANPVGVAVAIGAFRYGPAGVFSFQGTMSSFSASRGGGNPANGRTCQIGHEFLSAIVATSDVHEVADPGGNPVQEIGSWIGAFSVS